MVNKATEGIDAFSQLCRHFVRNQSCLILTKQWEKNVSVTLSVFLINQTPTLRLGVLYFTGKCFIRQTSELVTY